MKKIAAIQIDHIIRIIQHRAWEDFGDALPYESLRWFLTAKNSDALTQMQMAYARGICNEVESAECKVTQGQKRRKVYFDAALITSSEAYRRVFYPNGYDERFGGFGDDRDKLLCTPTWQEDKARWEQRVGQFLDDWADEDEKQDKGLAPPAAPVQPQTPAVRTFYGWTQLGSNHSKIRRFVVRTA